MNLPGDLKTLDYKELEAIAEEVRRIIIDVVSKNGGHLAPSLGVVELTIALLRMFDLERDKIIWDVGHQSYAYKILTDRLSSFKTLRLKGGVSGFCRPSESPYDVCVSGHTSVSVSAAAGVKAGLVLRNETGRVAAVIGDGAMSGGVAFEALNNLSSLGNNITVILNDNEMSISENVGGFASYLSKSLTGEFITRVKKDVQNIFEDAPLGEKFLAFAKKVESSVIGFLTPGSLFEELGIKYIGPINGHKIKDIEKAIANSFLQEGPVLIHVATVKGKGYPKAEECPDIFHGVGPFNIETGKPLGGKKKTSWTDIFSRKIVKMAEKDDRIAAVTAAMKDGAGLKNFAEKFENRFFDVGIAEQHAVTFCAGLAASGMRPYFAVYSTFLQRAFDQMIHDTAIGKLPVTFCIDRAGLVGADGSTHHGSFDMAYTRLIPNMTIMLPKDGREFEKMLELTLKLHGPSVIRYPRGTAEEFPDLPWTPLKLGVPEIVKRGKDVAIAAAGHIFGEAYRLYNILSAAGKSVSLINLRFLKPLNPRNIIEEFRGKKLVVTMEDGAIKGGAGEALQVLASDNGLSVPFYKAGLPDEFVEHGPVEELRKAAGLDAERVFKQIKSRL